MTDLVTKFLPQPWTKAPCYFPCCFICINRKLLSPGFFYLYLRQCFWSCIWVIVKYTYPLSSFDTCLQSLAVLIAQQNSSRWQHSNTLFLSLLLLKKKTVQTPSHRKQSRKKNMEKEFGLAFPSHESRRSLGFFREKTNKQKHTLSCRPLLGD